MTTKMSKNAKMIAAYRVGSASRRMKSVLNSLSNNPPQGVTYKGGVVTVYSAPNGKPVSALGGATKVFGRSKISVPEFTHAMKRSKA